MIFFTADTHFGHAKIVKYCNRPFHDVDEMDSILIQNWNSVAGPTDTVYHLGDFALTKDTERIKTILSKLRGSIILITGSHDKETVHHFKQEFRTVVPQLTIEIDKQLIFMSHYCHKVWDRSHYGTWHLFGHSHSGLNSYCEKEGKLLDVGVDCNDFKPLSFSGVQRIMEKRPNNFNLVPKLINYNNL